MTLTSHFRRLAWLAGALTLGCGDADLDDAAGPDLTRVALPAPDFGGEFWLSELALFTDIGEKRLSAHVIDFEPESILWSDGVDKRRWLLLPGGTQIDTADWGAWELPVGGQVFKQFSTGGKRLETRLIARTGPGPDDYWLGAFAWLEDESDALFVPGGQANTRGTTHDVPKVRDCGRCHGGERGRVLGLSAVQTPDFDGDLLTAAPRERFQLPGDETTATALGYLHANCGHCHNPDGDASDRTTMNLKLSPSALTPEDTNVYQTAVGVEIDEFDSPDFTYRVSPGYPEESAIVFRMGERTVPTSTLGGGVEKLQMPPVATESVDRTGLAMVATWIKSL